MRSVRRLLDPAGTVLDLGGVTSDIGPDFLADGGLGHVRAALEAGGLRVVERPGRIGSPVARPGEVVRIGLNYPDHAAESGA